MQRKWWHNAVVYEIYCKSFCDSNGDGLGDLQGVISKLPMLKDLGIDCIWFTPIYTSPMIDNGYDVADYYNIDPDYGTLEDFKTLLHKAHSMGIRVIIDMVLNHSSDECEWFKQSRSSKDNPYRNYYIWQPPKADGTPPNNWGNYFREGDGSAWEYDEATGEYYLHQYSIKMPDLNWEYEPLRQEIYKMLRWWLDLGVDGFRLDVFTRLKKPEGFPDSPKAPDPLLDRNGYVVDVAMCTCREGIHEILQDIHKNVFAHYDCFTVGEGAGITSKNAALYIRQDRHELDTSYHFNLANRKIPPFTLDKFRTIQAGWAALMAQDAWPVQYLSNHDMPRQVSRYGNDGIYRKEAAKLLAAITLTTPGTAFIYQGEEIGMTNVAYPEIEDYNCCYTRGDYVGMRENGYSHEEAMAFLQPRSRDNARAPYQWDASENAGFTTGKPWIKLNTNYKEVNLEADRQDANSIFAFYQKLIRLRKDNPAIAEGELQFYLCDNEQVLMYTRVCKEQILLVIANKSDAPHAVTLPRELAGNWKRLLTNREETAPSLEGGRDWMPWEVEIYTLEP